MLNAINLNFTNEISFLMTSRYLQTIISMRIDINFTIIHNIYFYLGLWNEEKSVETNKSHQQPGLVRFVVCVKVNIWNLLIEYIVQLVTKLLYHASK